MKYTDNSGIYIDLKRLHVLLYKGQFTMTKGDRIVMGNRILDLCQNCVSVLSRALNATDKAEKLEYVEHLLGEFDALRLNLQTCADLHIFKESRSTVDRASGTTQKVGTLVLQIFEIVGKVDDQIGRWRTSLRRDVSRK